MIQENEVKTGNLRRFLRNLRHRKKKSLKTNGGMNRVLSSLFSKYVFRDNNLKKESATKEEKKPHEPITIQVTETESEEDTPIQIDDNGNHDIKKTFVLEIFFLRSVTLFR